MLNSDGAAQAPATDGSGGGGGAVRRPAVAASVEKDLVCREVLVTPPAGSVAAATAWAGHAGRAGGILPTAGASLDGHFSAEELASSDEDSRCALS